MFIRRLIELIVSEQLTVTNEQKETVLVTIVQLHRVLHLSIEIYWNYDCDLYRSTLFEDLNKSILKNDFPFAGLNSIDIFSSWSALGRRSDRIGMPISSATTEERRFLAPIKLLFMVR
jgi:hypothetical protein